MHDRSSAEVYGARRPDHPFPPPGPAGSGRAGRRGAVVAGALTALWCWLGSWRVSYWKDEADSLSAATRSVRDLWRLVRHVDAVHAAYYLLLHGWVSLVGRSPGLVRLPSAVAIGLAAAAAYLLAHLLGGRRVAVVAALTFALLPRVSWLGIEARPFAVAAALAAWASYALAVGCLTPGARMRWWVGYGIAAALGIVVNIFVTLVVVAHGLTVLLGGRFTLVAPRAVRRWAGAAVAALVVPSPVVLAAVGQRAQIGATAIGPVHLVRSVVVVQWFYGNSPDRRGGVADLWAYSGVLLAVLGWAAVAVAVGAAVGPTLAARRTAGRTAGGTAIEFGSPVPAPAAVPLQPLFGVLLLVPWLLVPTMVVGAYTLVAGPLYSARYFGASTPALAILVALGLERSAARRPAAVGRRLAVSVLAVAVLAVAVLALPVYLSQRRTDGKGTQWAGVAAYVGTHRRPGDAVYFGPRFVPAPGAAVGATTRYLATAYPADFRGLPDLTLDVAGPADGTLNGRSRPLAEALPRLAGVRGVWAIRRADYPSSVTRAEDALLTARGLRLETRRRFEDVVVEYLRR